MGVSTFSSIFLELWEKHTIFASAKTNKLIGLNIFNSQQLLFNMPYGKPESDILFTRTVKAGKRIYYVDVKQDRNAEFYVAFTESKRLKEGTDDTPPQFEKHKIFIYRSDLERFRKALDDATEFLNEADKEQLNLSQDETFTAGIVTENETTQALFPEENDTNFQFEF